MSVDGVLASIEHSKLSKSMVLCFVVLWTDVSVCRRSICEPDFRRVRFINIVFCVYVRLKLGCAVNRLAGRTDFSVCPSRNFQDTTSTPPFASLMLASRWKNPKKYLLGRYEEFF